MIFFSSSVPLISTWLLSILFVFNAAAAVNKANKKYPRRKLQLIETITSRCETIKCVPCDEWVCEQNGDGGDGEGEAERKSQEELKS